MIEEDVVVENTSSFLYNKIYQQSILYSKIWQKKYFDKIIDMY